MEEHIIVPKQLNPTIMFMFFSWVVLGVHLSCVMHEQTANCPTGFRSIIKYFILKLDLKSLANISLIAIVMILFNFKNFISELHSIS